MMEVDEAVEKALQDCIKDEASQGVLEARLRNLCKEYESKLDPPTPKRQITANDGDQNENVEASVGAEDSSGSQLRTIKDVARHLLVHDTGKFKFQFILVSGGKCWSEKSCGSIEKLRQKVEECDETLITFLDVEINGAKISFDRKDFESGQAQKEIHLELTPSLHLVNEITGVCMETEDSNIPPWTKDLVFTRTQSELNNVNFPADRSKGAALVVTGESGSGKSWFAKNYKPYKFGPKSTALIYISLTDDITSRMKER